MKTLNYVCFIVLTIFMLNGVNAQTNSRLTYTGQHVTYLDADNTQQLQRCAAIHTPISDEVRMRLEELTTRQQEEWQTIKAQRAGGEATVTIPVVVHVLHNVSSGAVTGNNISNAQIISQIDRLNTDYAATNSDISSVPSNFNSALASSGVGVQFCLASTDPNGNPTTGITRTYTTKTTFSPNTNDAKFSSTGGKDAWSPCSYLNLWVTPSLGSSGTVLGYAQFPQSVMDILGYPSDPSTDGVVIAHNFFGNNTGTSNSPPFHLGRTASHEVGHYLGLFHIWGDDGGACTGSDLVDDTPNQGNSSFGCPTGATSCGSTDMVMNYMDYSDDDCLVMFSNGQRDRMQLLLNTDASRSCLLNSTACGPIQQAANFTINNGMPYCEDETLSFSDLSTGDVSSWTWAFSGGSPSSSSAQNPSVVYNNPGTYSVGLIVGFSDGSFMDVSQSVTILSEQACASAAVPCTDFVFGNNDGGPWIDLGMISCQGGASTGFGAWANEGYVLEGLPGGTYFNANICSGPGAGSWDPVLTVAQYDIANSAIGNVIAYIGDCSLDFFVANSGDYILVVTELGNCNGNAPLAIENGELTVTCGSVGINDTEPNSAAITLSIEGLSPVPATDRVQVNYAAVSNTDQITLRIYNLRGQLVANQALSSVVGNNTASLDISTYSAGVYLLSLYDGTSISTAKLVKK